MTSDEFAGKLPESSKARKNGDRWTARCPAHRDTNPSLSVCPGSDGRVLVKCHAGCSTEAICAAVGLSLADLMPPRTEPRPQDPPKRIVAEYSYTDERGDLLFQVCRFEPKTFRQRRPDPANPGKWIWSLGDVRLVPYRLPGLIAAVEEGTTVHICEGEKDADALCAIGFAATTNAGGAGKWRPEFSALLDTARRVVVIADKDEPGRKHAHAVAASLHGMAKSVKVVELPDWKGRAVKDAADFLAAGATDTDLVAVFSAAPEWEPGDGDAPPVGIDEASAQVTTGQPEEDPPPWIGKMFGGNDGHENNTAQIIELLATRRFNPDAKFSEPESVFELGKVTICTPGNLTAITAQAKVGKSALLGAMLAATFSPSGVDNLTVTSRNPASHAVLHFDSEQSIEDHWRLIDRTRRRAGVDRIPDWLQSYCLTGVTVDEFRLAIREAVKAAVEKFGGIHSIFIDGHADLVRDVNDAEESNAYVASMHAMAIQHRCPIVGVIHFNPGSEKVRGHLGSQLERKSETNLTLEKDGDLTVVWSVKQRRGSIPKEFGPRFRWSDQAGMHVIAAETDDPKLRAKLESLRSEVADTFGSRPSMRYTDMLKAFTASRGYSDRTAERRVSLWRLHRLVEHSGAGLFTPATCG